MGHKIVETQVHLQHPEYVKHYGSSEYSEIREKFHEDFWGCISDKVGEPDPDGEYIIAGEAFIELLRAAHHPTLRIMEAEFEYHGKVAHMPVPIGFDEDVYDALSNDGQGDIEKRIEKTVGRIVKEHGLPTVLFDGGGAPYRL